MKLLHVDSSILGENSVSRLLTADIVAAQTKRYPGLDIVYRDLGASPPLHLSALHMAAWHAGLTPEDVAVQDDLANGGALMDEMFAADIIVIGAPMYNFTIPSQLKAWIDRLVVAGRTFRYGENGPEGLLPAGKKVFIASSRGSAYAETPIAFLDHQESYLRNVLGFIGLTDVTIIRAEGIARGPEARASALAGARADIASLAA